MEIKASNNQGGDATEIDYQAPQDVIDLSRRYSPISKQFSQALILARMESMTCADTARALKTLHCLDTGEPYA